MVILARCAHRRAAYNLCMPCDLGKLLPLEAAHEASSLKKACKSKVLTQCPSWLQLPGPVRPLLGVGGLPEQAY